MDGEDSGAAWVGMFLSALRTSGNITRAAQAAGVSRSKARHHRAKDADFSRRCADAIGAATARKTTDRGSKAAARGSGWRAPFLEALAETSNVTAAAKQAGVPARTAYKRRRTDAQFAGRWLQALHEGYDHLEMELLGYLRDPAPKRKMDVAAALRLLGAHRDTVERHRALREEEDEQATFESIDRFLADMRQRRIANQAVLAERDGSADDGAP